MNEPRLIDLRMHDGSRHFGSFVEHREQRPDWELLRVAIAFLPGAVETGFVTDHVTEAWLDFTFEGHIFSLNNQQGEWWCFVQDPAAPDDVLRAVLGWFTAANEPPLRPLLAAGPLAPGAYRVRVLEADGRERCTDFPTLAEARQYADDAATEAEHGPVLAFVHDDRLRAVYVGRHHGASS